MKTGMRWAIAGCILLIFFLGIAAAAKRGLLHIDGNSSDEIDSRKSVEDYLYLSVSTKKTLHLNDLSYSFWYEVTIPGMPFSNEQDLASEKIFGESQCPQGICLTDDFLLLTSYSEGKDELGELFVFERETGTYLFTLGMNPQSHLGGIAFDGENVWICNSATNRIERISYDFIVLMANQNRGGVIDASEMVDTFAVDNTPSCITYYNDRLWIATHTVKGDSVMVAYHYDPTEEKLRALHSYSIPKKVQGIEFDHEGHVYLSTSYGRSSSSWLMVYDNLYALSGNPDSPSARVEMPPASEELAISEGTAYILFESAAEKYFYGTDGKGVCTSPIDKILTLDLADLCD